MTARAFHLVALQLSNSNVSGVIYREDQGAMRVILKPMVDFPRVEYAKAQYLDAMENLHVGHSVLGHWEGSGGIVVMHVAAPPVRWSELEIFLSLTF